MSRGRSLDWAPPIAQRARSGTARLAQRRPVRFALALVREVNDDDLTGMSAEMAYRFLFAVFPLVLLSAAVIGLIGAVLGREDLVRALVDRVMPFLPGALSASADGIVSELVARSRTYALIGLVAALWGAASGIGALIKGLNRAYDVERPRPTWRRLAIAIAAALIVPPTGLALLVAAVLGQSLLTWLGDAVGITGTLAAAVAVLESVAIAVVFFLGICTVYRWLPALRQRLRDVVPGAAVATVAWLLLTQAFGVYVANLDGYRATYGAFAAAISFLLWLYLVSLVVLVGAEINALFLPRGRHRWADEDEAHEDSDERMERGAQHG